MIYCLLKKIFKFLGLKGPKFFELVVPQNDAVVFVSEEDESSNFLRLFKQRSIEVKRFTDTSKLPEYSLVTTCYNEADGIEQWLESVAGLSVLPIEVVICDGGSNDSTQEIIQGWQKQNETFPINFINEKRCNIAEGRNKAAMLAVSEILLFSDVGSVLKEKWAENLLKPFAIDESLDVVMGWYEVEVKGSFSKALAHYMVPKLEHIDPQTFLPSGRSLGIKKELFDKVGGYPEHLTFAGEDSLFDIKLKEQVSKVAFSPEAIAVWSFPKGLVSQWQTIRRYALGDAEGRMNVSHYVTSIERILRALCDVTVAVLFVCWVPFVSIVFFLSAIYYGLQIVLPFKPFTEVGIREGLNRFFAVLIMVLAQTVGFIQGFKISR